MERKEFEQLVARAFDELPEDYKSKLENIDVVIEDLPDIDTAKKLGLGTRGRLLGLYQGVPLKNPLLWHGNA